MADTKISQLPAYPSGTAPRLADIFLVIDTSATPFVSRQASLTAITALASGYSTIQSPSGIAVAQRQIVQFVGAGVASVVDDAANNRTVVTIAGGGGGGGTFTGTSRWTTANAAAKNAYTSPGVVNDDGITINLVASAGSGSISNIKVTLNNVTLPNTYASSGTFPNYTVTVPVEDLTGNPAEITNTVTVAVLGLYNGSNFNLANAGVLTNIQPIPFTTVLSGNYNVASVPYYTTLATLNYSYTNSNRITSFGGVFTPTNTPLLPQNATAPSGSFPNVNIGGAAISGTAVGNGQFGAAQNVTITLTGSVAAIPQYTPAFYLGASSTGDVAPIFTTTSLQTPGAAVGASITYATATAANQYIWLATTRPITSVRQVTAFGPGVVTADVTTTQSIAGTSFNVFGFTNLTTTAAVVLQIIS